MSESAIEQNTPSAIDELYSSLSDLHEKVCGVGLCAQEMGAKLLGSEIRDKEKKEEPPRAGTIYQMIEIVDKCRAEVMYMKGKINAISRGK